MELPLYNKLSKNGQNSVRTIRVAQSQETSQNRREYTKNMADKIA